MDARRRYCRCWQPLFIGDDANQNPKLPVYWLANLMAPTADA
jgi:hypothetical protein